MTIKKLKSIDIINVLSDLVSKKLETTVKLPALLPVAVEHNYIKEEALEKLKAWKVDPHDESWTIK